MANPVEIEFLMKDNLTPGMDKAGQSVDSLSKKAKMVSSALKAQIKEQSNVVKQVQRDVKELEKAYSKATPGKAQSAALSELNAAKKALEEDKAILADLQEKQTSVQTATEQFSSSLRGRLREMGQEIAQLTIEYRNMSEAEKNSASGQQMKAHIEELTEEAGVLRDAMMDTNDAINNAASDTRGFDQMAGGLQLVVDGFGLATGAAQLFGENEEDLAEAQTKLQSILVVSNALTSAQTQLQKQSAVMQGISILQTKAAATAETIKTLAQGKGIIATTAATVAQAAFNAVAKANPYVLLAGAVITVVGALLAFSKGSAAAKKAEEERQAKMDEMKRKQEEYRQVVVEAASEQVASFLKMKREWENLGDSFDKKKKFITNTKDEWAKLGKEINTVNQMENLFKNHTSDMLSAIILRAQIKAYDTRIQQIADDMVKQIDESKSKSIIVGGNKLQSSYSGAELNAARGHYKTLDNPYGEAIIQLDKEGSRIITNMRKVNEEKSIKDDAQKKISGYVDEMKTLQSSLDKKLGVIPGNTINGNSISPKEYNSSKSLEKERRSNEDLLALQRKNQRDEIELREEGKEKKIAQIKQEYAERKAEIDKQEAKWKQERKGELSDEQRAEIEKARTLAKSKQNTDLKVVEADSLKAQVEAMQEYLQKYGTMQQQKLAITEEYAAKIAEVNKGDGTAEEKMWKVKSLEKERNAAISQNEAKSLAMNIDWGTTFEGVGNVLKDIAKETLTQVEAYMKKPEFKALSATDKKTYTDLQTKLKQETGGESTSPFNFKIWGEISKNVTDYQTSVKTLKEKTDDHTSAVKELEKAQSQLAAATDDTSKSIAQKAVDIAQGEVDTTGAAQTEAQEASDKAKRTLTDNTNAAAQGIQNFTSYLNEMSNGSLYGFANGMTKLITSLGKGSDGIGKSLNELGGKIGGIIGAILQLIDALGDDPKGFIDSLLTKISDCVETIIAELPEIIISLIKNVGSIITGVWSGIASWFGVDDLFGLNGNEKDVKDTISKLTDRSERLQKSIEDLTDVMNSSYGKKSTEAYEQAKKNQEENNQTYLEKAQAQAGYWKHHHSWNYYWDGFNANQTQWINNNVKEGFDGNIWGLSPEEMRKILSNEEIANYIKNTGKGGYGSDVLDMLEEYADQAGKIEELTDQWRENITQVSFDSMKESFISDLMDMSKGAEDFADDFSEMMQRALLSYSMEDLVNGELKDLYDDWATMIDEKGGSLDDIDIDAFNKRYDSIVEEGLSRRDQWADVTGYNEATHQSGKSGSFNAMSQDQGTKLEGLFTSVQMHSANIDENIESVTASMNAAESHLAKIEEHTGKSATDLGDIKEDVKKIIRDGLKMK